MFQKTNRLASGLLLFSILLAGCAKERPVKSILSNGRRLPKTIFQGTYFFQKTITHIQYAGKETEGTPIGSYEISNKLIQFETKENTLDILAIDPLFKDERAALKSNLLSSFAIKHVDVLRKQNSEGLDTYEEEETENRRPWKQRAFIRIDPTKEGQDNFSKQSTYSTTPDSIEVDSETGIINIEVTHQLKDETQLSLKYSFLPYTPRATYIPKLYSDELARRFGMFSTSTLSFDKYGRVLESETKKTTVINRWDTGHAIVYYFSKDFPLHLKPAAQNIFAAWNKVFEAAVGKPVLELRENTGQTLGDLRYSMIHYDPSIDASHGILGYGPSYTNPRTGEIIKGDVILYGGVLKASIARERLWEKLLNPTPATSQTLPPISSFSSLNKKGSSLFLLSANKNLLSQLKPVNPDWVSLISKTFHPIHSLYRSKQELLETSKKNMTRLTEDVFSQISKGVEITNLSDDELEIAIFTPLLTHELGHNWGLRHNFMASADKAHYASGSKSSSVMDYAFLTSEEPTIPGGYDIATIQVAYGTAENKTTALLNDNYLYCTDEDVMSSLNGMCHPFDSGTTLSEIVQSQFNRYLSSWAFNNLRNDRVYFNGPSELNRYLARVQSSLTPLRLIYDHADAIIRASKDSSMENLWSLLKQQIEPDPKSDPKDIVTVNLITGIKIEDLNGRLKLIKTVLERKIDVTKIPAQIKEATKAKALAYQALTTVILNTSRPDYSTTDPVTGDLQLRGVIYDKMMALLLLGSPTTDPIGGNSSISLFASREAVEFRLFLTTLLSDTAITNEGPVTPETIFEISPIDSNLKEIALTLFSTEQAISGGGASARKLIQLTQMQLERTSPFLTTDDFYRQKARKLYQQLLTEGHTQEESAAITAQIQMNQIERNRAVTIAITPAFLEGNLYYVAPVSLIDLELETASGHLIRDNINVLEDMIAAAKTLSIDQRKVMDTEIGKPESVRDTPLVLKLLMQIEKLQQTVQNLTQFAEHERSFLDKFYKLFNRH